MATRGPRAGIGPAPPFCNKSSDEIGDYLLLPVMIRALLDILYTSKHDLS